MKNKRLLIILGIFAFLTLLVVLGSTVFTASEIEVRWLTTTQVFSTSDNESIIESGEFNRGESIFFVNKSAYIAKLEKQNPYLKVVGIETVFPNKLVLHVAEREVWFALQTVNHEDNSQTSYLLLDNEGKVLEKSSIAILPATTSPIVLTCVNVSYTDEDFECGDQISDETLLQLITGFSQSLQQLNYTCVQAKAWVASAVAEFSTRTTLTVVTNWGITIEIADAQNRILDKLNMGNSVYNLYHDSNPPINSGTILVYETEENEIEASYVPAV